MPYAFIITNFSKTHLHLQQKTRMINPKSRYMTEIWKVDDDMARVAVAKDKGILHLHLPLRGLMVPNDALLPLCGLLRLQLFPHHLYTILSRQAVSKDLTSSSKFSGSCVLTLQTLLWIVILFSQGLHRQESARRQERRMWWRMKGKRL